MVRLGLRPSPRVLCSGVCRRSFDVIELGFEFQAMASACEIRIAHASEELLHSAAAAAIDEVRRIERKYSRYDAASVVSRFNATAGRGAAVAVDDESAGLHDFATSGDYERYFEIDGKRYCHMLDPRTGWPVSHWQSVSVLAPTCAAAGALCTVAMLMGDAAETFLQAQGVAWIGIGADGQKHGADILHL